MDIIKKYHTNNDCFKAAKPMIPKGIVVHSTGAGNPWLKRYVDCPEECGVNTNGNHWNRSSKEMKRSVCAHAFIGYDKNKKIRVAQILPYNYQNWLTGGSANKTHIGFEICEPYDLKDKEYFNEMWNVVVEYCAMLCKEFELDPMGENVIIDHATAHKLGLGSNHSDVGHWWPKYHGVYLDDLRKAVAKKMGISAETTLYKVQVGVFMRKDYAENLKEKLTNAGFDTYLVTVDNLYKVQVGAYSVKENAEAMLKKLSGAGYDGFITK